MLAFFGICDILFSVMRDRIELEEVFNTEELSVTAMAKSEQMEQVAFLITLISMFISLITGNSIA